MVPNNYSAVPGETVKYTCLSGSRVIWKFDNTDLPTNAFPSNESDENHLKVLQIYNVQIHNAGTYMCMGKINKKRYFEAHGVLHIDCKYSFCARLTIICCNIMEYSIIVSEKKNKKNKHSSLSVCGIFFKQND